MRLLQQSLLVFSGVTLLPVLLFAVLVVHDQHPSTPTVLSYAVVATLASGILAWLSMSYLLQHIRRLLQGVLTIAQGSLGHQVPVDGKNELAELAHALNYMSNQTKVYDDEQKELIATIKRGSLETVRALVNAIHARDAYTRGHANRVSKLAVLTAKELGLEGDQLLELEYGAILHDIGKIGIRDEILLKPSPLKDDEMKIMRSHPEHGKRILGSVSFLKPVIPLVLHHHEWWDGSGYPAGLKGEDIPLGARIIAVADTYDAITTNRPYQAGRSFEQATPILEKLRGTHFDPKVLEAMYAAIRKRPYRMFAAVSDARASHLDDLEVDDNQPAVTPGTEAVASSLAK